MTSSTASSMQEHLKVDAHLHHLRADRPRLTGSHGLMEAQSGRDQFASWPRTTRLEYGESLIGF
jgi:hypothetical protein